VASDGTTTSAAAGVLCTLSGSSDLSGVVVRRCTITGCYYGVNASVASANSHSFVGLQIASNTIHACGWAGILVGHQTGTNPRYGAHDLRFTDIWIGLNTVYDVYGATNAAIDAVGDWPTPVCSGFGMILYNLDGGLIERNLVHHTGAATNDGGGGPTGVELCECDGTTFARNEVHHAFDPDGIDGQGIDLDGGCRNCVVEGNWVHDCDGPAMMDLPLGGFTATADNVFRWNVSQDNGRGNSAHNAAFVSINGARSVAHNNTDYFTKGSGNVTASVRTTVSTAVLRNNNFSVRGSGANFGVEVAAGTTLQGNNYDAAGGASFSLTYDGVAKTSLASLRGVAETVNGVATGSTASPSFASGGGGAAVAVGTVARNVTAYDSTPLATTGLDLLGVFGTDPGETDFHGGPVRTADGYPVGAVAAPFPSSGGGSGPVPMIGSPLIRSLQ
jgi:hypothetical protein